MKRKDGESAEVISKLQAENEALRSKILYLENTVGKRVKVLEAEFDKLCSLFVAAAPDEGVDSETDNDDDDDVDDTDEHVPGLLLQEHSNENSKPLLANLAPVLKCSDPNCKNLQFENTARLYTHRHLHHNNCTATFMTGDKLKIMRSEDGMLHCPCGQLSAVFKTAYKFKYHALKCSGVQGTPKSDVPSNIAAGIPCDFKGCSKQFCSKQGWRAHVYNNHVTSYDLETESGKVRVERDSEGYLACSLCLERFMSYVLFRTHYFTSHERFTA